MAGRLENIIDHQIDLMNALGVPHQDESNARISAAIGMSVESSEVLDLLNKACRPWKPQTPEDSDLIEETVDVLFYVIEFLVLLKLSAEEVEDKYIKKCIINHARIASTFSFEEREDSLKNVHNGIIISVLDRSIGVICNYPGTNLSYELNSELTENDYEFLVNPVMFVRRKLG